MNWIAVQSYFKVERKITSLEQLTVVEDRLMYLYKERIVTKHREFPILDVFDLSYKQIGGEGGLLYLHTRQGVFSYTIKDHPQFFIDTFKELVRDSSITD